MPDFPDWNDLRDILLIAEAGTLSAAARASGVSQSTMSRRLAAIEATGNPVFLRDEAGRMTPNSRGRVLVDAAREMQAVYEKLRQSMTDAPMQLRIVACDMSARLFLGPALPVWAARSGRHASVTIVEDFSHAAGYEIMIGPMASVPEHCAGQSIGRVEWGLYASPGFVVTNKIRAALATLDGQPMIRAAGSLAESPAYRWLSRQGGSVAMLVSSTGAMIEGCAAGMGIALLPVSLAENDARLLPVQGPRAPSTEVWAITEASRAEEPQIAGFFRWARNHFRHYAPGDRKAG